VRKAAEQADFSALDPRFRLARLALLERADDFFQELSRSGYHTLAEEELVEWPILAEMRYTSVGTSA
jgi:hypothetical protein